MTLLLRLLAFSTPTCLLAQPETVHFPSGDGIEITADFYRHSDNRTPPLILLFHQAGSSRGEYVEIAPRLNELGFNCLAVDLRSGKTKRDVDNKTHQKATAAGKSTDYTDSIPDMLAAARFARANYATGPILAWGSSYSAGLVLHLAGTYPGGFAGVVAFSPGEYFVKLGKSGQWIASAARNIHVPVFVTSARNETDRWKPIFHSIPIAQKVNFIPETEGRHGSQALWSEFGDSESYWTALTPFLKRWTSVR